MKPSKISLTFKLGNLLEIITVSPSTSSAWVLVILNNKLLFKSKLTSTKSGGTSVGLSKRYSKPPKFSKFISNLTTSPAVKKTPCEIEKLILVFTGKG